MTATPGRTLVGVDGCKGGWICVSTGPEGSYGVSLHATFAEVVAGFPEDALIVVDMPIGLPEIGEAGGRVAEKAARQLPNVPRSSIFSIPSRAAVYSERGLYPTQAERLAAHRRAVEVGRRTSPSKTAFSVQAFCIFPKIIQIDEMLASDASLRDRVNESHPEVAFRALNGWLPLPSKKINGRPNADGMAARRAILVANGIDVSFLSGGPPRLKAIKASDDDFLDAACMLLVAMRRQKGDAKPHPYPIVRDALGIPVAIWA